ncbi:MAG: hypothetical protein LBE17_09300 [Treponema sp.]|jgi:ABC-type xylose transport system permease subunit|nr:hypothetical protein [Treponema sp.]
MINGKRVIDHPVRRAMAGGGHGSFFGYMHRSGFGKNIFAIGGALMSALALLVMRNGMTLPGLSPYSQKIPEGIIIVDTVIIDMCKNAKKG